MATLFRKKGLKPKWTFTTKGIIWRLFYSESKKIVGEIRNADSQDVSFFCLDACNGKPLWENMHFDEKWWIGIENVDDRFVYFHRFIQPNMPQHQGIECRTLDKCEMQWRNDELTFWYLSDEKVCAYKDFFEQRKTYWIDRQTGNILNDASVEEMSCDDKNGSKNFILAPMPATRMAVGDEIQNLIQRNGTPNILQDTVEAIETYWYWIVGYYCNENENKYSLHLEIIDRSSGESVYSIVQEKECLFQVPENFFVADGWLYFVKDKHKLNGIELWK
ncbi:MAG: DUF4905 domain-containing protein [Bacteroidetes bacterium]|nr:DUF4905 domain-containing protein [Bacteroidota bacterium]